MACLSAILHHAESLEFGCDKHNCSNVDETILVLLSVLPMLQKKNKLNDDRYSKNNTIYTLSKLSTMSYDLLSNSQCHSSHKHSMIYR